MKLEENVKYEKVPGYDIYFAGDDGSIWSLNYKNNRSPRKLKARYDKYTGYIVSIFENGKERIIPVAKLVLMAFYKNLPENSIIININGDTSDNRLSNLLHGVCSDIIIPEGNVEYRDVVGYPGYKIGSDGTLISYKHSHGWYKEMPKIISPYIDKSGRKRVALHKNRKQKTFQIAQLVMEAFVGVVEGMEICHSDGDPGNNNLSNLRWDTHKANMEDMVKHGRSNRGERNPLSKLTKEDVRAIKEELDTKNTPIKELADRYGIVQGVISSIRTKKTWKWLDYPNNDEENTVIIDTRERKPFSFDLYNLKTTRRKLDTGDYSVTYKEKIVSIDRKRSIAELSQNLFYDYDRFKREMERAKEIKYFFLLFEVPIEYLLIYPHGSGIPRRKWPYLRATPRKILERIKLLYETYGVRCIFSQNREEAEQKCADILLKVIKGESLDELEFFLPEIKNE